MSVQHMMDMHMRLLHSELLLLLKKTMHVIENFCWHSSHLWVP